MPYLFNTPSVIERTNSRHPLLARTKTRVGISVLKFNIPTRSEVRTRSVYKLDITTAKPYLAAELQPAGGRVIQCTVKEPTTGNFFVTMNVPGTAVDRETTILSRLDPSGSLLDSMTLTDAGHGANIAVQMINGNPHIWLSWRQPLSTGGPANQIVRFQYRAGATLDREQDSYFTTFPKFAGGNTSTNLSIDWDGGWFAQIVPASGGPEKYVRRKLADVMAGIDKVYNTIPTTTYSSVAQGFATLGDDLYRYGGSADYLADDKQITRISWVTGQVTGIVNTGALGKNPDGTTTGNYREPEGITVYRDPTTGAPSLLCGVVTGPSTNNRFTHLFRFDSKLVDEQYTVEVPGVEQYRQVRFPASEDIAAADAVYLGGYDHIVSDAEAASLQAAGYTDLTPID